MSVLDFQKLDPQKLTLDDVPAGKGTKRARVENRMNQPIEYVRRAIESKDASEVDTIVNQWLAENGVHENIRQTEDISELSKRMNTALLNLRLVEDDLRVIKSNDERRIRDNLAEPPVECKGNTSYVGWTTVLSFILGVCLEYALTSEL